METKRYQTIKKLAESGIAGGIAGGIQLSSLYWLRTIIKYQYVYPYSIWDTTKYLWNQNDRIRLFRGFIPNFSKVVLGKVGEASLIKHFNPENSKDIFYKTLMTSAVITGWKTLMMPLDTLGNSYQVNGIEASNIIKNRIKTQGWKTLWSGTIVYLNISFLNYTIWVYTFHHLNYILPKRINQDLRNGIIGLTSTLMSDIVINPLRVIKTNIQSQHEKKGYLTLATEIFQTRSDYFRGFKTKMLFNCLNGALYVIIWRRLDKS